VIASSQKPAPSRAPELGPSPSESASFTLSQAELDVPNMQLAGNSQVDASLRQNLRTLNAFIAECEQHLKQNPQDELAREYLYTAYQQKADLLAAMMESGRGDN
jgi:ribosomal protein S15P/S13E